MTNPLHDKNIILGVTGSIAAYKAADLASKLTQSGANVHAVLTPSATNFITPITFQSVTGKKTYTDKEFWEGEGHVIHILLGQTADAVVIAPATANTIAKLANGIADNLLTVTALASPAPVIIAPAMDGGMVQHPATQHNLSVLRERGVYIIEPVKGHLASGQIAIGRMEEPSKIMGFIRLVLSAAGPLKGRKVVITAGGTQEPIDVVRAITNRSSGKQGIALAQAALDLGANVTVVSGPTHLEPPIGVNMIYVRTAQEMHDEVLDQVKDASVLLMAAAVADFRPSDAQPNKVKKQHGIPSLTLELTPDILEKVADYRKSHPKPTVVVGFAAESQELIANAQGKLIKKNLDMVVANDIKNPAAGFDVDTNQVTIIHRDGSHEETPVMSKTEVSELILDHVVKILLSSSFSDSMI